MGKQIVSSWGQLLELGTSPEPSNRGMECRILLRHVCDVTTSFRPVHQSDGQRREARVRDITLAGIGLLVNESFSSGTVLRVELPALEGHPVSTQLACVVHSTPCPDGHFLLGCSFVGELQGEDLELFGAHKGALQKATPGFGSVFRATCARPLSTGNPDRTPQEDCPRQGFFTGGHGPIGDGTGRSRDAPQRRSLHQNEPGGPAHSRLCRPRSKLRRRRVEAGLQFHS